MRSVCIPGIGVALLLFSLACSGAAPPQAPVPVAPVQPVAPVPSAEQAAATGLAADLGFPVGKGTIKRAEADAVDVLYRSAFNAGEPFADVRTHLESRGWVMRETRLPPFRAIFEQGDDKIELAAEGAGSSVWIRARRK